MKTLALSLGISFLLSMSVYAEDIKFGEEIKLTDTTKISDLLLNPDEFIGKNILIEGEVTDICKMRGCWMKVSNGIDNENIIVKVKDGDIVFPKEAKGKNTKVEGELYKVELSANMEKELKNDGMIKEDKKTVYMFKPKAILIED